MILCFGESLIDLIPKEDASGATVFMPVPGGSPFNTAIALGRLGIHTGFLGAISTDFFGEMLISYLKKNSVDPAYIFRSQAPTSLAFVSPETKKKETSYQFYMDDTAATLLQPDHIPRSIPSSVEALLFGSTALATEPIATTLINFMQKESGNRLITLDPNIRPSLISDPETFRSRFAIFLECADIVKVSLSDLAWLFPSKSWREFSQMCLGHGVSVVFLTDGGTGAWGITNQHEVFSESERIDVKDSIGAGDSFHAGMLTQLSKLGKLSLASIQTLTVSDLENCLHLGTRAAAITCSRPGADPPWKNEL